MSSWFTRMIFRWRCVACCAWLVLLGAPGLLGFRYFVNGILWQPWTLLPSFRQIFFISVYLALLMIITLMYSLTYTAKLPIFKTRLVALWDVFSPNHFVVVLILSLIGSTCSVCLTELTGYSSGLWSVCTIDDRTEVRCVNEYLLFHAILGAVYGFFYGCSYYFHKEYFLVFPSIQKHKLFRLHCRLSSHLWSGVVWSLKVLRFYYPFYFIFGFSAQRCLVQSVGLYLPVQPHLNGITGLVDISLAVHSLLVGTFIHLSWTFALRLFRIYQTEAVSFPVVATFSEDSGRLLGNALSSDLLLLKLLGFLDLYQLSLHSPLKRKQVFSLSAAGQPLVWNLVCDECLKQIKSLTDRLLSTGIQKENGFSKVSLEKSEPSHQVPVSYSPQNPSTSKGWPSLPVRELVGDPGAHRRHVVSEQARLWSYSPGQSVERVPYYSHTKQVSSITSVSNRFRLLASRQLLRLSEHLKKKPFFIYFLNELPNTSQQQLFADCQLQVWTITSISELAITSYSEDMYGVVQRSLNFIVGSLIDLSQALDKHVKAPLSSSKSTRNVRIALENNGKYAIKTAVQTALFRLAATFSKERRSLQLSPANLLYWNKYLITDSLS